MKIGLITDEVSADPETAFELGAEWGVRDFEIRGFDSQRVPLFSPFQKDYLRELMERYRARVYAISPGLFKMPYPDATRTSFPLRAFDVDLHRRWRSAWDLLAYHLEELLPSSLAYAREIGAQRVIAFGFHRGGQPAGEAPDGVLQALQKAAQLAGEAGLLLDIEVEADYWADTGARTARMLDQIAEEALGVNWDPANAAVAGDKPYPEGYQAVEGYVRHVHFKDVRFEVDGAAVYTTRGVIDWEGQIRALQADGYEGYISVETHMQPKVASARVMTARLQGLLDGLASE